MAYSNLRLRESGSLCILGLDWLDTGVVFKRGDVPPVRLIVSALKEEDKDVTAYVIPSLTKDGRISLVSAGETLDDFHALQKDISTRFTNSLKKPKLWRQLLSLGLTNFLVVGFMLSSPEDSRKISVVCETFVLPVPVPELFEIYTRLNSVASSIDDTKEIESYFEDSVRKKWLDEFVLKLETLLDWPKFVADAKRRARK